MGERLVSDATKPCRLCQEDIKATATYCIHCHNFQNWRGRLSLSSTVLSLLVALTAVVTAAVPVIQAAVTPKNSEIRFSLQTVSQEGFSAFVSNTGIRPGTVQPGSIVQIWEADGRLRGALLGTGALRQEVIQPGTSLLRSYRLPSSNYRTTTTYVEGNDPTTRTEVDDTFIRSGRERFCRVSFSVTDFVGVTNLQYVPFDCTKLPTIKIPVSEATIARLRLRRPFPGGQGASEAEAPVAQPEDAVVP